MNVQEVLANLDMWHRMIADFSNETEQLYKKLIGEEIHESLDSKTLGNLVKEASDVIVVCRPIITNGTHYAPKVAHHLSQAAKSLLFEVGVNWWQALHAVNQSNFSKLILENELKEAYEHFKKLGIDVCINPIAQGYFGAYSTKDQTVNCKEYAGGKLLKGPKYQEIDESIEWWK